MDMFGVQKPSHPGPIFNFICSGGAWAQKSCQNPTEQVLAVLMGNEKNCTPKSVGMFRALIRFIRARFSTLHAPVVPGLEKVVNIRPKHFSAVLIGNDKKCVPNNVGMFWLQNRVIRAGFSVFPAPVVLSPEKRRQNSTELLFNHTDGKQ